MRVYDTATGEIVETIVYLRDDNWIVISPDGHYRASPAAEKWLCYVVLTEDGGQLTLSPAEFAKQYGWKNDPQKVAFAAP